MGSHHAAPYDVMVAVCNECGRPVGAIALERMETEGRPPFACTGATLHGSRAARWVRYVMAPSTSQAPR